MVARITKGHCLSSILQYNEQKLKRGQAQCLMAANYLQEAGQMNYAEKLFRLEYQARLNENIKANSVHISINFDPTDSLPKPVLQKIAQTYMEKIGFGEQPYLVYQHVDAGHPHLHIVTTNIQMDGSRIDMHRIGQKQSAAARKEIEQRFQLVPAQGQKQKMTQPLKQENTQKVQYGKRATKQSIEQVLQKVLNEYKYTSLDQLNAVLRLYRVQADRGKEDSRLFQMKGLYYRVLDEKGNRIGAPIKASAFAMKPTLKYLEQKFNLNETLKQQQKQRVKVAIEWTLSRQPQSFSQLIKSLEKEQIYMVAPTSRKDQSGNVTFIDQQTKCIYESGDLGKQYTAPALKQRCQEEKVHEQSQKQKLALEQRLRQSMSQGNKQDANYLNQLTQNVQTITSQILAPVQENAPLPNQLKQTKRKRKKQSLHL